MGLQLKDFIDYIKKNENLRFDSHVADFMGVDPKNLAMNKMRKVIPIKYIQWYCKYYDIDQTEFTGHLKRKNVEQIEKGINEVNYVIEAQSETIKLQREKIKMLEESIKQLLKDLKHIKKQ